MNKAMCLVLLLVSQVTFQLTNAGILKIRKRSIEGNTSTILNDSPGSREVVGRFVDDPNEAVSRFRNILPIWWHYFLPMIQITMRDDNLRQELQKTYEHEHDSVEVSNDEQILQSRDFDSSMNGSPPVDDHVSNENSIMVPNMNFWGSANSGFTGIDDPNETQESKIGHDTTEMDNNVEQFTGNTDEAFEMSVNEASHNDMINTFANFEPSVTEETDEAPADDVKIGQEIDNSETVGNTEDSFESLSNTEQSNEIMPRVEFETTTGNIDNMFTDSASIFEQPSHDEVDRATVPSGFIEPEVNNAMWNNNNMFATNFESTLSEGTFDDRMAQSHHHGVLSISDDISSTHDVSEHPTNVNDGIVNPNPWVFPREENRAADSDFVPSFMSSMPFFSPSSQSSESDSSS